MSTFKTRLNHKELIDAIHGENRRRGWSLSDLADHLCISSVYMSKISQGTRSLSGLDHEKKRMLAHYIGISLVEFLIKCEMIEPGDFPNRTIADGQQRLFVQFPLGS